jgi:hypothetical protein
MWKMNWQSTTALMVIGLVLGLRSTSAQSKISEPFTPVNRNKLSDATPQQSERLNHLEHLRTTEAVHVFRMNPDADVGDRLKISIPNDRTLMLSRTGGERYDSKDFTWVGEVQGEERSSATLISRNGEITGSINTAQGLYRITPLGDRAYAVVKVNPQRLPPEEPPTKNDNKQ